MQWKTFFNKWHDRCTKAKQKKEQESLIEALNTLCFKLALLEANQKTPEEVIEWAQRQSSRRSAPTAEYQATYIQFYEDLQRTKLPPPEERWIYCGPHATIRRAILEKIQELNGGADSGVCIDLEFLVGDFTNGRIPTQFVWSTWRCGTWICERPQTKEDETKDFSSPKTFVAWWKSRKGSVRHSFIVDIPNKGEVLSEVSPQEAYRFLTHDTSTMTADEWEQKVKW